jgi:hypothetical protein
LAAVLEAPLVPALGPEIMMKLTKTPPAGIPLVVTVAVTVRTWPTLLVDLAGSRTQAPEAEWMIVVRAIMYAEVAMAVRRPFVIFIFPP